MSADLSTAVVSIARTQRGRFFWAAWWTALPTRKPFRVPDASNGGAESWGDARDEAERFAGRALTSIDPAWARAVMRGLRGEPSFTVAEARRLDGLPARARPESPDGSIWAILGVRVGASTADIKRAYRERALATHPDHGGDAAAFRVLHRGVRRSAPTRPREATAVRARATCPRGMLCPWRASSTPPGPVRRTSTTCSIRCGGSKACAR